VPEQPRAWLTRTARNKAIDRIRRRANFRVKQEQLRDLVPAHGAPLSAEALMAQRIPDDRLRLVFTCCHPALKMDARVALTLRALRALGGLTTEEIARAFLVPMPTMAQRLVRAQQKITKAGIPYPVPPADQLPERVAGVCAVVYLVFNEGYAATGGGEFVRGELCEQAIQVGRVLAQLMPEDARVLGLLALMLLHDSRRSARLDADGDISRSPSAPVERIQLRTGRPGHGTVLPPLPTRLGPRRPALTEPADGAAPAGGPAGLADTHDRPRAGTPTSAPDRAGARVLGR
jgi:RNA polymerase sigma-70 factor (ECF subfamily)